MRAKFFFAILTFISFAHPAQSAWFGPDNYEECSYEKVKDCNGDKNCASVALNLCDKEFPFKLGKWKRFAWEEYSNANNEIRIVGMDFETKLCLTNMKFNLEENCRRFEYDTKIAFRKFTMQEIATMTAGHIIFLNNTKSDFLEGTTYIAYRAERKRIEK